MNNQATQDAISRISRESWRQELELISFRYVRLAVWAAIIFDPIFAFTDYLNIPEHWFPLFIARLAVSVITLTFWLLRKRLALRAATLMYIPFLLISLQNASVYAFIREDHVLAQNLNFMALMIGASLFVLWHWSYSLVMIALSAAATISFLTFNPSLSTNVVLLNGGLLLACSAAFMAILINARYNLTIREIKTRLALIDTVQLLQSQSEEIQAINENLENLVQQRTSELQRKTVAIEDYTFLTAHQLRGPVASVLGLIKVFRSIELPGEAKEAVQHLDTASHKLDSIVNEMLVTIERPNRSEPSDQNPVHPKG